MCVQYSNVQYSTVYSGWLCGGEAGTRASAGATLPQRQRQRKQTVAIRHRDQPDTDTEDTEDTVHTFLLHTQHCTVVSTHCQPQEVALQPLHPVSARSTASMELKRKIRRKVKVVIADKSFS